MHQASRTSLEVASRKDAHALVATSGSHRSSSPSGRHHHKILLVTDMWDETNGLTTTLRALIEHAAQRGHTCMVLHPAFFARVPIPFYRQYALALPMARRVADLLQAMQPQVIHIATEGPLGVMVRRACVRQGWRFTSSYHTRWDQHGKYLAALPPALGWMWVRWFHARSTRVMVPTPSVARLLRDHGLTPPLVCWSKGIDTARFHPRPKPHRRDRRPILLYVGRLSREKNLRAFLDLSVEGTKYVVGDGPLLAKLQRRYRDACNGGHMRFFGEKRGTDLARLYAEADVFVFPSQTETFGNVILEALASGLPVAAYPAPGPLDIVTDPQAGALHTDLGIAVKQALAQGRSETCVALARRYTWEAATDQFLRHIVSMRQDTEARDEHQAQVYRFRSDILSK